MINCYKDFEEPSNFLIPIEAETESNKLINVNELGKHFIGFYENGIHKTYNFTL